MKDVRRDGVEKIAIVADDDNARRVAREIVDEPQRAFEIEIIRRLVEQQQIGLREENGRERDPHAPAAREFRQGTLLGGGIEAEAMEDRGGARRRRMGLDVGEPRLNLGDVVGVAGRLGAIEQRRALDVGGEHEIHQRGGAAGRLLFHAAEPRARGQRDLARFGRDLPGDETKKRRLAGPVAANEARARAAGQEDSCLIEEQPAAEPICEGVDCQHDPRRARGLCAGQ